jgi:glucose/arabinose dehydrogenase
MRINHMIAHSRTFAVMLIPAGALLALLVACGQAPPGRGAGEQGATPGDSVRFKVEKVVGGLEVPWTILFLPGGEGDMLITERPGRVRIVRHGILQQQPVFTVPGVEPSGESGLMGMTLHPRNPDNGYIYIAYAYKGSEGQRVRVARYRYDGNTFVDPHLIIEGIPAAANHAGCRLRFGPDGKLYITTGDATDRQQAQNLGSLGGKILRLNDDGSIPSDNPFVARAGARPEIWSYGQRNPQGIDWQPGTNTMFETEHGPSGFDGPGGGDEVNIIERGANYGWPIVHHRESHEGMISPLLEYTPAIAPASGMFYTGAAFPQFKNDFFFSGLKGECIIRAKLDGSRVVSQERIISGTYGRIRDIAQGPDGAIYFSTSNRDRRGTPAPDDDRILRLVPVR